MTELWEIYHELERTRASYFSIKSIQRKINQQLIWLGRKIIKIGRENRPQKMRLSMLGDDKWRARVMKDLGGEAALTRWDRLKTESMAAMRALSRRTEPPETATPSQPENPLAPEPAQEPRYINARPDRKRARSDRRGVFFLPPIPRPHLRGLTPAPKAKIIRPEFALRYKLDPLIPVTPDELRRGVADPSRAAIMADAQRRQDKSHKPDKDAHPPDTADQKLLPYFPESYLKTFEPKSGSSDPPRPEQSRPDPHMRCPHFNGGFKVTAHAHREDG